MPKRNFKTSKSVLNGYFVCQGFVEEENGLLFYSAALCASKSSGTQLHEIGNKSKCSVRQGVRISTWDTILRYLLPAAVTQKQSI